MKKLLLLLLVPFCLMFCACGGNDGGKGGEAEAGTFYTVTEAYEKGYLTREQVMSIAYYHNEEYSYLKELVSNKELMSESYTPLPKMPEKLSSETEKAIKQTYLKEYWKDEDWKAIESFVGIKLVNNIDSYYGTYNDCVAVMLSNNYASGMADITIDKVADIEICYNSVNKIKIWKKSTSGDNDSSDRGENIGEKNDNETDVFYSVTEAYEMGYITREQVMSIAYYHNEEYFFLKDLVSNKELMSENYTPLPKTPEKLSDEIKNAIKQTYFNDRWKDTDVDRFESVVGEKFNLKIKIDSYYGTYNGCVAVMMTDNYTGYATAIKFEKVAGIEICYNNANTIKIWKQAK